MDLFCRRIDLLLFKEGVEGSASVGGRIPGSLSLGRSGDEVFAYVCSLFISDPLCGRFPTFVMGPLVVVFAIEADVEVCPALRTTLSESDGYPPSNFRGRKLTFAVKARHVHDCSSSR